MEQLIKIALIFTIVSISLGVLGRVSIAPDVAISITDLGVFLTVLFWGISKGRKISGIRNAYLFKPITLFVAVCLLSLVINSSWFSQTQLLVASLYLFRWVAYTGIYFVIKDFSISFKKKIFNLLIVVGVLTVFLGYVQYFLYPSLRNLYYLGWDEHLYRMFSIFLDPNFAGIIFSLTFFSLLGLAQYLYVRKHKVSAIGVSIIACIVLVAISLTYSRSALLMLFASLIVYFVSIKKTKFIFVGILLFTLVIFISPKSFQTEGTNLLRVASGEARVTSLQKSWKIFIDHPLIGVGFDAYRYAQYKYGFIQPFTSFENHAGAGTENSLLFLLATTGIVGFLSYFFIWKKALTFDVQKIFFERIVRQAFIVSLVGVFFSSLFINSLFYPFVMLWMWTLFGIIENT